MCFDAGETKKGTHMITRLKLKQYPELDPNLARETQQIRDRRNVRRNHEALILQNQLEVPKSEKRALQLPHWKEAMD